MVLNVLYKCVGMFISLIYVPIVLKYLGNEKYGVWITISSVVSWITYFDIGIGNGLRNRLVENISNNDIVAQKKTVSTAYISISIITAVMFFIIMIMITIFDIPKLLNLNLIGENINIVILINIIFICINFILSLCNTILYALQLSSIVTLISIIPQIINIIIIYILTFILDSNLTILSIVYGFTILSTNIIASLVIFKKYKQLRPSMKLFDKQEMKHINEFGIKMFILQISALILNTTDNILISKLYGAEHVTPYNMVYKAFSYINMIHMAILSPMWSSYTMANSQNNIKWLKKSLKKMEYISIIFVLVSLIMINIFPKVSYIWLGKKLNYSSELIIITAFYFILLMWSNVYSSFLCGVGRINVFTVVCMIQAILNIPLSIFFAIKLNMGLSGVVMGSLVVMLLASIVGPIEVRRWFKNLSKLN